MNTKKRKQDVVKNQANASLIEAIDILGRYSKKKSFNLLSSLVAHKNITVRKRAIIALADLGDKRGLGILKRVYEEKKNAPFKGTIMWAMKEFDCSKLFLFLVGEVLSNSYEVQCFALDILFEQKFVVSRKMIEGARKLIVEYRDKAEKCEDWEVLLDDLSRAVKRCERKK